MVGTVVVDLILGVMCLLGHVLAQAATWGYNLGLHLGEAVDERPEVGLQAALKAVDGAGAGALATGVDCVPAGH